MGTWVSSVPPPRTARHPSTGRRELWGRIVTRADRGPALLQGPWGSATEWRDYAFPLRNGVHRGTRVPVPIRCATVGDAGGVRRGDHRRPRVPDLDRSNQTRQARLEAGGLRLAR